MNFLAFLRLNLGHLLVASSIEFYEHLIVRRVHSFGWAFVNKTPTLLVHIP